MAQSLRTAVRTNTTLPARFARASAVLFRDMDLNTARVYAVLASVTCGSGGIEWQSYDAVGDAESNAPVDTNHVGHFGAGFIDYQGPSDQYITWTITVPSAGDYLMQVGYALSNNDRPLQVEVNGAAITIPQMDGL